MTCMKQEFCIHEKYCQRNIGQNFDSCILFSRNSKPMTNEEWFCGLSTEEKADWLEGLITYCFGVGHITESEQKKYQHIVADVEMWLKQPHEGD